MRPSKIPVQASLCQGWISVTCCVTLEMRSIMHGFDGSNHRLRWRRGLVLGMFGLVWTSSRDAAGSVRRHAILALSQGLTAKYPAQNRDEISALHSRAFRSAYEAAKIGRVMRCWRQVDLVVTSYSLSADSVRTLRSAEGIFLSTKATVDRVRQTWLRCARTMGKRWHSK